MRSDRGWPCSTGWASRRTSRPGSTSTSATTIASRSPAGLPRRGRAEARAGPRSYATTTCRTYDPATAAEHSRGAVARRVKSIDDVPRLAACRSVFVASAALGRAPRGRQRRQALANDSWKILIERFIDSGWRVVVVGGIEDFPLSSVLEPHDRLRDWTGSLTVTQTTALLERADLFIGSDSGPAHLAASAGTLSVILFSGTNQPRQWRPWSRHSLVLRHRVACQPCHQKVCPLADHPCMSGLSPDRVYRGAAAVVVSHPQSGVAPCASRCRCVMSEL